MPLTPPRWGHLAGRELASLLGRRRSPPTEPGLGRPPRFGIYRASHNREDLAVDGPSLIAGYTGHVSRERYGSEPHGTRQRPPQRAPTNRRKQGRLDVSPSLQRVKLGVEASGGDQLVVGSLLNNPTALEHHDVVGHAYRGEPMRYE